MHIWGTPRAHLWHISGTKQTSGTPGADLGHTSGKTTWGTPRASLGHISGTKHLGHGQSGNMNYVLATNITIINDRYHDK